MEFLTGDKIVAAFVGCWVEILNGDSPGARLRAEWRGADPISGSVRSCAMASIIKLRSGALPPAGCDWVLVERTPAGRFNVTVCTSKTGHSLFVYDQGLFPLASAVAKAIEEADRLGIGSVHIQEGRSD